MFNVRSSDDAAAVLSFFNGFHDAFVESVVVVARPESPGGFGFALPVRYDVTLSFVHSNYRAAEERGGREQRIEMRLFGVGRMKIGDIVAVDNMLQDCRIEVAANGTIEVDVGGDGLVTFECGSLAIEEMGALG